MIEIYTDGSCRGNGKETNEGGFGVVVLSKCDKYSSGYYMRYAHQEKHFDTTNNRMEMQALISAIDLATNEYSNEKVIIYCDSAYCVNMCRDWIWTWSKNGWKNSKKQIVENIDLVYQLYDRLSKNNFPNFTIEKVSGHSNNLGNELADALATQNKDKLAKICYNYEFGIANSKNFDEF